MPRGKHKLVMYGTSDFDEPSESLSSAKHPSHEQPLIRELQEKVAILEDKVAEYEKTIASLHEQILQLLQSSPPADTAAYGPVTTKPPPHELTIPHFHNHLNTNLVVFQFLAWFLVNYLLSAYHRKKSDKVATDANWKNTSVLYQSFLLKTLVRSKHKLAILPTHLLLGVLFYLHNIKAPIWNLLRKLRIIPAHHTVQQYLHEQPLPKHAPASSLVVCFDNNDFWQHVTHKRQHHASILLQTINYYSMEAGPIHLIEANNIWLACDEDELINFANHVAGTTEWCENLAQTTTQLAMRYTHLHSLKDIAIEQDTPHPSSNIIIHAPFLDRSTSFYADIEASLGHFHQQFLHNTPLTYLFVAGDEQTFTLMWKLRIAAPEQYQWLVPIAGDFHWYWHVLKGIFRVWGRWMFVPIARLLEWRKFDLAAKNFQFAEDFFNLISIACLRLLAKLMENIGTNDLWVIADATVDNANLHGFVYFTLYYVAPYWSCRSDVKCQNHAQLTDLWKYFIHLFIATNKSRYARLSIRYLWMLQYLHPDLVATFQNSRFVNLKGMAGCSSALDMFVEKVLYLHIMRKHVILYN